MHHFLQPGEKPEDYSKERFEQIIRHVSGLPEEPVEVISMRPWVMSPKVAMRFRLGRVLLVGDAAARLSPAGGLGLNTGLQSAHNLAWKLAAVVRGEASELLLDSYETERHGAALQTMENTNENAGEVFAIVEAGLRGEWDRVRELVAHNRRAGAGLGQDLGIVYERGAFVSDGTMPPKVADRINDYVPSACPGCRAPHVWILRNEGTRSILDLFEGTMVLLAGRMAPFGRRLLSDRFCVTKPTFFARNLRPSMGSGKVEPCWCDLTDTLERDLGPPPMIRRAPCMRPSMRFFPNERRSGRGVGLPVFRRSRMMRTHPFGANPHGATNAAVFATVSSRSAMSTTGKARAWR